MCPSQRRHWARVFEEQGEPNAGPGQASWECPWTLCLPGLSSSVPGPRPLVSRMGLELWSLPLSTLGEHAGLCHQCLQLRGGGSYP